MPSGAGMKRYYYILCSLFCFIVAVLFLCRGSKRTSIGENQSRDRSAENDTTDTTAPSPTTVIIEPSLVNRENGSGVSILSKTLLVRRCYFDDRKRNGHRNAVVFLVEMKRSLQSNVFTGCHVGSKISSKVHFRKSIAYKWAIENKKVTKNIAFIDCFDMDSVKDETLLS